MEALIYKGLEGVGFTETNPDKGTETSVLKSVLSPVSGPLVYRN